MIYLFYNIHNRCIVHIYCYCLVTSVLFYQGSRTKVAKKKRKERRSVKNILHKGRPEGAK